MNNQIKEINYNSASKSNMPVCVKNVIIDHLDYNNPADLLSKKEAAVIKETNIFINSFLKLNAKFLIFYLPSASTSNSMILELFTNAHRSKGYYKPVIVSTFILLAVPRSS